MKKLYRIDLKRYGSSFFKSFLTKPGYRFILLYRCCKYFSNINLLGIVARIWFKNLQVKYGYQIPHSCKIGNGFFLGHYGNIVINQHVIIGNNCNIAQGVTVGNISIGRKKGCPKVGNNVWIGTNSVIVGNISIGNNVLIAPLTYLNMDVPDDAVVAGNPGKIINYKGSSAYIKNTVKL